MTQIPPTPDDGPLAWLLLAIATALAGMMVLAMYRDSQAAWDGRYDEQKPFVLFEGCRVPAEERK